MTGPMLLRAAERDDALAVAGVHVRSWQVGYRGLLPDGYLDGLRPEDRAGRYTFGAVESGGPETIVATDGGVIHGFATVGPSGADDGPGWGELQALYVDPGHWRVGVGRALLAGARARLASQGFVMARLWVLAGNARAERFYGRDGWARDGSYRREDVWGVAVENVGYRRSLP